MREIPAVGNGEEINSNMDERGWPADWSRPRGNRQTRFTFGFHQATSYELCENFLPAVSMKSEDDRQRKGKVGKKKRKKNE